MPFDQQEWDNRLQFLNLKMPRPDVEQVITMIQTIHERGWTRGEIERLVKEADYDWFPEIQFHVNLLEYGLKKKREVVSALEGLIAWMDRTDLRLRPTTTRNHRLMEALREGRLITSYGKLIKGEGVALVHEVPIFIVKHDWASVLGDSIEEQVASLQPARDMLEKDRQTLTFEQILNLAKGDGTTPDQDLPFYQPYPACFFEMSISGVHTITLAIQPPNEGPSVCVFVEIGDYWMACNPLGDDGTSVGGNALPMIWRQIVAVCVAMDAQLVDTEEVVPDAPLNKKRIKNGKPPIRAFNVVDLARRIRQRHQSTASEYKGVVRLHLRRSHFRHYEDGRRVRIPWTLVGNPDLGFIDKHYTL